jgi:hypothetical protein
VVRFSSFLRCGYPSPNGGATRHQNIEIEWNFILPCNTLNPRGKFSTEFLLLHSTSHANVTVTFHTRTNDKRGFILCMFGVKGSRVRAPDSETMAGPSPASAWRTWLKDEVNPIRRCDWLQNQRSLSSILSSGFGLHSTR